MRNSVAVIFDMDGVIVDTNPHHKISLRQFCEKYGYQLSDEELLKKIYGRTNKEWIANLFDRPLTVAELSAYGEEKEKLFRDIYEKDIAPVAGLEDFLKKLEENNIPKAIGTSAPKSNVDFILDNLHLRKYFNTILDESNVNHGKPNPEIYLKVAAALQFPPERCIVFEDSLSGVASAQAAGSKVVGITTTHSKEELSHTDYVIDNFIGLDPSDLIKKVFK
ncbi:MAG: HAD family phosphatase [Cyclobacteriaceae bacterium]|nr:HAD family phosphatase [Cyclobacteriaceae bacterium]